ncbi:MAG: ATP-binding protein [Candidatus Bathyarchaeota archaeon]
MRNAAYAIRHDVGNQEEMTDLIDRNIVAADNILKNLVDFATLPPLRFKEETINYLLQETLAQTVFPWNVKATTQYGTIPLVEVDSTQLSRVFTNLVFNALQAMPKGGEFTVSTSKTKDYIEIKIKDTGIGIPQDNMKKMFTPFFTTKSKGTGLGLINAKRVVEAHRGTIDIESQEGKFTVVSIQLPIKQPVSEK